MEQALEQPDFPLAVRSLETLTEQVARCQNLPAANDGRRLAQALEAINSGMQGMREEMRDMRNEIRTMDRKLADLDRKVDALDRKVDALDRKVDGLDRKVNASNKNFTARIQNSTVLYDKVDLVRLHSVVTGALIRDFPKTLQDLDALSERQVDALMTELGEEGRGRPDERRQQLEMALGVVARATRATRRR